MTVPVTHSLRGIRARKARARMDLTTRKTYSQPDFPKVNPRKKHKEKKGKPEMENLAVCPEGLKALDPNAVTLWAVFLKRVGLHVNSRGEVIENDGRRADIVRRFGVRSLLDRLPAMKSERDRARIWWRETIACSEGESDIPDLSAANLHVLNPFIISPEQKYPDPRVARLAAGRIRESESGTRSRGRPVKSDIEKRATNALRQRAHRASKRNVLFAV